MVAWGELVFVLWFFYTEGILVKRAGSFAKISVVRVQGHFELATLEPAEPMATTVART